MMHAQTGSSCCRSRPAVGHRDAAASRATICGVHAILTPLRRAAMSRWCSQNPTWRRYLCLSPSREDVHEPPELRARSRRDDADLLALRRRLVPWLGALVAYLVVATLARALGHGPQRRAAADFGADLYGMYTQLFFEPTQALPHAPSRGWSSGSRRSSAWGCSCAASSASARRSSTSRSDGNSG